jgi:hypothetical protein
MSRFILLIAIGIFLFLILKLVKLLRSYGSGPKLNVNGGEKDKDEIRKHFESIQEAEFREIDPDDDLNGSDKNNG